jgi:hypothetical protein
MALFPASTSEETPRGQDGAKALRRPPTPLMVVSPLLWLANEQDRELRLAILQIQCARLTLPAGNQKHTDGKPRKLYNYNQVMIYKKTAFCLFNNKHVHLIN